MLACAVSSIYRESKSVATENGGDSSAENRFRMRCGSVPLASISFLMAPMKFIPRFFGFRCARISVGWVLCSHLWKTTLSYSSISATPLWIYYLIVKIISLIIKHKSWTVQNDVIQISSLKHTFLFSLLGPRSYSDSVATITTRDV